MLRRLHGAQAAASDFTTPASRPIWSKSNALCLSATTAAWTAPEARRRRPLDERAAVLFALYASRRRGTTHRAGTLEEVRRASFAPSATIAPWTRRHTHRRSTARHPEGDDLLTVAQRPIAPRAMCRPSTP